MMRDGWRSKSEVLSSGSTLYLLHQMSMWKPENHRKVSIDPSVYLKRSQISSVLVILHGFAWMLFYEIVNVTSLLSVDAGKLCVDNSSKSELKVAPTKEVLSLRAYTAQRRLNRVRRAACRMFQSDEFVKIIHKLEIEITCHRLAIRKDRKIHADLGN